jgi:ATP-dependent protease HslVU (ClpYQ) peptidase subunit
MEPRLTTIATDGNSMAADGRACRNDVIVGDNISKMVRLADKSILGLCGRSSVLPRLAKWLEGKGAFPKDCGDWSAIHLTEEGPRLYSNDAGEGWHPLDLPAAVGSGCEFALGAMLAKKSPQGAINLAAQRDPFTGGKVEVLYLKAEQ